MSSTTACSFCGRENDSASRFCIDCGKALSAASAPVVPDWPRSSPASLSARASAPGREPAAGSAPAIALTGVVSTVATEHCPRCAREVDPGLPFCGHCGARVTSSTVTGTCGGCGATYLDGVDVFCARCGQRVGQRVSVQVNATDPATQAFSARKSEAGPRISLLDDNGAVKSTYTLDRGEAVLGRGDADIRFDDVYLSPMHARFELREGELWVRDLGSRNGTWTFIEQPTRLADGDVVLVGSQLLRFRRLGYPGPHPPEADSTRRMGSLTPSADVAVLEQLRADGSVRDCFHLSPARTVMMGRESGDWVFPYDQTMSGRHAEIRSQDAEFYVYDAGSRNGVALSVRGDRPVKKGQRVLLGDQVLRIESIGL